MILYKSRDHYLTTEKTSKESNHGLRKYRSLKETKIYNKRDDFDILNFRTFDRTPMMFIFLNLFDLLECLDDLNTRNKVLTAKLLRQGYRYKIRKAFSKFYRRHFDIVSKYNGELKTLPFQGLSEPEIYGDLAYKFGKIIGKNDFPYHFKKIIVRYKKIGYNIDNLRQTACLVINPIKVINLTYLFDCTTVVLASDGTILNLTY